MLSLLRVIGVVFSKRLYEVFLFQLRPLVVVDDAGGRKEQKAKIRPQRKTKAHAQEDVATVHGMTRPPVWPKHYDGIGINKSI